MPSALLKSCAVLGCPNTLPCPSHTRSRQDYDRQRGSAAARGYGSRWRRYRARFLAKYPLCGTGEAADTSASQCRRHGRVTAATLIHHTVPVTGPRDPLFWRTDLHLALCRPCHEAHHGRRRPDPGEGAGRIVGADSEKTAGRVRARADRFFDGRGGRIHGS